MEDSKKFFIIRVAREIGNFYSASEDVRFFIACQFALESDFGNSSLAKSDQNFCGMKKACLRPHVLQTDDLKGFAKYKHLVYCVIDYCLWLSWNNFRVDYKLDKFIIELKNSGYCPERDYIDKIQTIYKQFKLSYHE